MEEKYTLKQVSELVGLSPRVISYLEKEGFISPEIRAGKKYYSEKDLEIIRLVKLLKYDLGVNMAGIEIIINMRERMLEMLREREEFIEALRVRLKEEIEKRFGL